MASLNRATILGNCTKDPDSRQTAGGTSVTSITIATNEKFKNKQGEYEDRAEFHNVTLFGKTADVAAKYLSRGSQCLVEGRIQTEKYEKDGVTRYSTKIVADKLVLLGGKGEGGNKGQGGGGQSHGGGGQQYAQGDDYPTFNPDDDIPF